MKDERHCHNHKCFDKIKIEEYPEELFDVTREEIANAIGIKKEKLFVDIYGTDEEKKDYYRFVQSISRTGKTFRNVAKLIDFTIEYPDNYTFFYGEHTIEDIQRVMKILKLKWHLYIKSDYGKMTRDTFVGKLKITGVIEDEK